MKLLSFLLLSLPLASTAPISKRLFDSPFRNDLLNGTPCRAITIIFARGTLEQGNVGTLAGPPFFDAVADAVGAQNVAVQGVDYPADIPGFLAGGDQDASQRMAQLVQLAERQCPSTSIVLSGYSQGGQLVHNAARLLSNSGGTQGISSVVIFGDPDNGEQVQGVSPDRVLVLCDPLDNICYHGFLVLPAHLSYAKDAPQAAQFVVQRAQGGRYY
ncbi:carbohydrate esterase family 5 protein [Zasmidium cellare ATCC 36951]|uniref:Cutinase n=1 Tax=Zasmidium cellare ATCC 36951 TaxID=1080233 RepID=A0A6A6C5K0_ZASCE|nr:carbohydrate esterase family 5 protein [Zasmidium cellare ATCC 36951]KAF2162193.1 carbohydrate esterase family 5 protein [Zasmidium cellare ATCC 36951]